MAIPLLNLDDRDFNDLSAELRALIPRYAPAWTNHNAADPGVTVMELFAWLAEAIIYRINRVPDTSRRRFMELLGATHLGAQPAMLRLRVCSASPRRLTLPRYAQLLVYPDDVADPVPFETLEAVDFSADSPEHTFTVRQTARLENVKAGSTTGDPYQLFRLDEPFALPPAPFPRPPQVFVGGERWQYVTTLRLSEKDDKHFTIKPRTNMVLFGDGTAGAIPPLDADITASWRTALVPETWRRSVRLDKSSGAPRQVYRLPAPVLPLDLQLPSDLQPQVTIARAGWDYCSSLLDSAGSLAEFTVEPWSNGLRFGDGVRGRTPPAHADVWVTYRTTLGAIESFEPGAYFAFMIDGQVSTALQVQAHSLVSKGTAATALDEARQAALTLLKRSWRGITCQDLDSIILANQPDTFGLQSVAGDLLPEGQPGGAPETYESAYVPAQIGIVVTPKPRYVLPAAAGRSTRGSTAGAQLGEPICAAAGGSPIVTAAWDSGELKYRLWNPATDSTGPITPALLPSGPLHDLAFTPDGTRLVLTNSHSEPWLFDTAAGTPVNLHGSSPAAINVLSPDGSRWLTVGTEAGDGTLRLPDDGSVYAGLAPGGIIQAAFAPDNTLLATAHAAPEGDTAPQVILRRAGDGAELVRALPAPASVAGLAFSPDSRLLAVVERDDHISLYRAKDGGLPWIAGDRRIGALTLPAALAAGVESLVFSPTGKRLLTLCAGGTAYLWSLQTCQLVTGLAHRGTIRGAVYSADGSRLATYDDMGHIYVWQAQPGTLQFEFELGVPPAAAAFNAGATCLATIGGNRGDSNDAQSAAQSAAGVWDLQRGGRPLLQRAQLADAALHVGGQWLAWIEDNLVTVWDIQQRSTAATLHHGREDGDERVHFASQSYAGALLTTVAEDRVGAVRRIRVWNAQQVQQVQQVLDDRHLITSHLQARGPAYSRVGIEATLVRSTPLRQSREALGAAVTAALLQFFDPLIGGPDGSGWQLGRPIYRSEVYQVLERTPGIDHVASLAILALDTPGAGESFAANLAADLAPNLATDFGDRQAEQLTIPPHHLVNCVASAVTITVRDPERMPFIVLPA